MNNEYVLLLPLAAQPSGGFTPGSQIDFLMNHPGKLLEKGSLRLVGRSKVSAQGGVLPPTSTLRLNSNAGAHSFLNHLIIMFDENNVEMNTEYARYVAANNESRKSCLELGALSSEVIELTGCDQDGSGDNLSTTYLQGQLASNPNSMPFSILLNCCLNKSSGDIPLSRTKPIRVRMILKQPSDIFCGDENINVSDVSYTLSDLSLRYVLKDDPGLKEPVIMERIQYAGQQTLQSTYNTFNTICPSSFNSCILLFKDYTHTNSTTFMYDSILNENFEDGSGNPVISNYVEWTLMGMDTPLTFPLRTQEEQIQNYILSHNKSLTKHGLNYAKLNNPGIASGWGLGCWFGSDVPSMPVQCTINFNNNLGNYYNVYVFYKGSVVV